MSGPYLRPVSKIVNDVIGGLPNGPFNFGLYFNKWFFIERNLFKCHGDVPRKKRGGDIELGDNLETSVRLFNGQKVRVQDAEGSWSVHVAAENLSIKHAQQEKVVKAYERLGYKAISIDASLDSPLVIGLGNEHPTEKGFRFDWTTGIPAIPATSIKGVVRLAYLVNELNKRDENEAERFWNDILKGNLKQDASSLFGCGEGNNQAARRGKVIFLDAFPKELPRLKAEIMNCHYPDYLNKDGGHQDFRGPTEDQQPNPQKFWAVDSWVDKSRTKPLRFIFRVLAPRDIVENEAWFDGLNQAIVSALGEHGLGAKTAIGHGRFSRGPADADPASGRNGRESVGGHPPQPPKADPEAVRREILELYSNELSKLQPDQLPGQIGTYLQKIRAQEDDELKHLMCRALLEKGRQLGKKKKFSKALSNGKQWALDLKALCDECGVET
jgi:CRISPR-associated protein Cmr6